MFENVHRNVYNYCSLMINLWFYWWFYAPYSSWFQMWMFLVSCKGRVNNESVPVNKGSDPTSSNVRMKQAIATFDLGQVSVLQKSLERWHIDYPVAFSSGEWWHSHTCPLACHANLLDTVSPKWGIASGGGPNTERKGKIHSSFVFVHEILVVMIRENRVSRSFTKSHQVIPTGLPATLEQQG